MKLARELKNFSRLPLACRQFLDKKAVLHQACEGMTGDQVTLERDQVYLPVYPRC